MAFAANFLDTNILIYTIGADERALKAQALLEQPFVVSVQTLNEFANASRKKLRMPWTDIAEAIEAIIATATVIVSIDEMTTLSGLALAQRYNFSFYDAAMVSTALHAGCERYYSEDLQHGLVVDKQMTVINPFR
jgi:predicted nucleic acid-binding protein